MLPRDVEYMDEVQHQRHIVRPGLTGLAQCSGRNSIAEFQTIVFALAVSLLSHFIIDILYGAAYREARGALLFLIWSTVFSAMSNPRAIWMISENKQRYNKYILLCGVVVNLFLNGMLIPIIGINGAAFATLITELV